jgi:hypothetical protein
MIDWKRKLTSRKFWVAVVTLVSGLILAFGGDEKTAKTVGGCIMSAAAVVAYTIGEGLSDAANAGKVEVYELPEDEEPKE